MNEKQINKFENLVFELGEEYDRNISYFRTKAIKQKENKIKKFLGKHLIEVGKFTRNEDKSNSIDIFVPKKNYNINISTEKIIQL